MSKSLHDIVFAHLERYEIEKGGPGSGNRGHMGRPGRVGGSAPSAVVSFGEAMANKDVSASQIRETFMSKIKESTAKKKFYDEAGRVYDQRLLKAMKELRDKGVSYEDSLKDKRVITFHKKRSEYWGKVKNINVSATRLIETLMLQSPETQAHIRVHTTDPKVRKHIQHISQFVHKDVFGNQRSDINIHVNSAIKRASYSYSSSTMSLGTGDRASIVNHEFGHHIENCNNHVYSVVKKFFADRTSTETIKDINKSGEKGKKDHFIDPYCGRVYSSGKGTEILSMGIQQFFSSPISFAQKDPQHFDMVIDILRGKYKNK